MAADADGEEAGEGLAPGADTPADDAVGTGGEGE
jgi:hypothetical protein